MAFSATAGKCGAIIAVAHPFFCGGVVSCIMSIFLRLGCILAPRFPLLSPRFGSGRRLVDSKQYLAIDRFMSVADAVLLCSYFGLHCAMKF